MGWYDELPSDLETAARMNPAGLAIAHTSPYAEDSGQRWKLYPYARMLVKHVTPALTDGGKVMAFMPPRHGKSILSSVYSAAWFLMSHPLRNVILTSYSADLSSGFSARARDVVADMGHLWGIRINPKQSLKAHWQIQIAQADGSWTNGGSVYAAGVDGPLPGRGASLIVMDDVVRGHSDTTPLQMQKAYTWFRSVLETRMEPIAQGVPGAMLLVMTRWAMADLAGRLLEDEPDEWEVLSLPALAKEDDPLGRELGEALCEERYSKAWLEKKRDSSDEGGIIFSALYQQEPMPEDGAIFKGDQMVFYEHAGDALRAGHRLIPESYLRLWYATIDPALKDKQHNDPTGVLVWCISESGELILWADHTARMSGSTDLIPLMRQLRVDYHGIQFFVEDAAHGTEIVRACHREGLPVMPLKADRDKVTRAIGAQPAFAASKVWFPEGGASQAVVRELLEFPGGRHDDRVDCVAYGVQVWRDRGRQLHSPQPLRDKQETRDSRDIHPSERPKPAALSKGAGGHYRP